MTEEHAPRETLPTIDVLTVGGTIDKIYSIESARLEVGPPFIEDIRPSLRTQISLRTQEITRKDSLDLDDSDRQLLLEAILKLSGDKILVTHGTDTLSESAAYIANGLVTRSLRKTVVFTGSFVPGCVDSREAAFNLGFALAVVQSHAPGVYIAIGGRVYRAGTVTKDSTLQRFISTCDAEDSNVG